MPGWVGGSEHGDFPPVMWTCWAHGPSGKTHSLGILGSSSLVPEQ